MMLCSSSVIHSRFFLIDFSMYLMRIVLERGRFKRAGKYERQTKKEESKEIYQVGRGRTNIHIHKQRGRTERERGEREKCIKSLRKVDWYLLDEMVWRETARKACVRP